MDESVKKAFETHLLAKPEESKKFDKYEELDLAFQLIEQAEDARYYGRYIALTPEAQKEWDNLPVGVKREMRKLQHQLLLNSYAEQLHKELDKEFPLPARSTSLDTSA